MLKISKDLSLPPNAVTQKLAALGISGSGKTYAMGKFVEELLDAHAQVVIVDTVGNWSGLRLAADGKRPGIVIPILGGERGDIPLESHHGKLVAETVVGTSSPLIVDVSDFTQGELRRFVVDFATSLLALKKRRKSPVMVVWEECQDIVPQGVRGDTAPMVGAVEKLIKKGRNYGVGTVLISQRAAAVNKDVLNQIETLFCFRQNAKHDRKAVSDWIVHQSIDIGTLVNELPTLATGECFCWSPHWLGVLKKITFGKKRTFDASATPEIGDDVTAGKLAPVDLERFRATMAGVIERAKADDPKALRARIAELERELAKKAAAAPLPPKVEFVPFFDQLAFVRLKDVLEARVGDALEDYRQQCLVTTPTPYPQPKATTGHRVPARLALEAPRPSKREAVRETGNHSAKAGSNGAVHLGKGERVILTAVAQHRDGVTREQLTVLTGYKRSSRDTYLQRLNAAGMVVVTVDGLVATDAGVAWLGPDFEPLPTGAALREHWLERLPEGERVLLANLVEVYPKAVPRDWLDERSGYKRSSRDTYLQRLGARRLVEAVGRGEVRASATLFD